MPTDGHEGKPGTPRERAKKKYEWIDRKLKRYARRRIGDPEAAADIVQDVHADMAAEWPAVLLLIAERALSNRTSPMEELRKYMYTAVYNKCASFLRHPERRAVSADALPTLESYVEPGLRDCTPADLAAVKEEQERDTRRMENLRAAIDRLSEPYRTAMRMQYVDGKSNSEIAERLRILSRHVAVLLFRGREMLRDLPDEEESDDSA